MLNYVEVAPLFCSVVYVGFSAVLSFCVLPVSRLCVSPLAVYALVLRPAIGVETSATAAPLLSYVNV